jgi:hypothetical protein
LRQLAFSATLHCLTGCAIGDALSIAFVAVFPVNIRLIRRRWGHAVVHQHHGHDGHKQRRHGIVKVEC